MNNLTKLAISVIGCELLGILGTPFTAAAIPAWYAGLVKPVFAPPNWVFGPVWTTLYLLMGVAFFLIWRQGLNKQKVKIAAKFFLAQLGLNFIWSPIFFGLRAPFLGLVTIIALWFLIVITMNRFYAVSKPAFYLLVPYLLWVTLATFLNAAIVILN